MSRCSPTTSGSKTSSDGTPLRPESAVEILTGRLAAIDASPELVLAAVAARVGEATSRSVPFVVNGNEIVAPETVAAAVADAESDDDVWAERGPWLLGFVREALVDTGRRRSQGVHHTAPAMVDAVLDVVDVEPSVMCVLDPACGGGAFLLGAAARMSGDRADVASRLHGVDVDPVAVATTRAAVDLWAGVAPPAENFVVADFLDHEPEFVADLVVGNPPFLAQLKQSTASDESRRRDLSARWPEVSRYVDLAAAFLLASLDCVRLGGTVGLVLPSSVLAASDAEAVRARVQARADLRAVWVDDGRRFAASVDTVAVVARRSTEGSRTPLPVVWSGVPPRRTEASVAVTATSWAPALAAAHGVPPVPSPGSGTACLADVAAITAGFRDQFYGLRGAVSEAEHSDSDGSGDGLVLRLVTSGLIDPLRCRWGESACRFDGERWARPVVHAELIDPPVTSWFAALAVPKVVVASQTKVIEAAVDPDGSLVPCTPVVSVVPFEGGPSLHHVVAVLTCPVATARLVHAAAGSALSADAVRVSARALGGLALPSDGDAWDAAADAARRGDVELTGQMMLTAHSLGDRQDLFEWWRARLPGRSQGRR